MFGTALMWEGGGEGFIIRGARYIAVVVGEGIAGVVVVVVVVVVAAAATAAIAATAAAAAAVLVVTSEHTRRVSSSRMPSILIFSSC